MYLFSFKIIGFFFSYFGLRLFSSRENVLTTTINPLIKIIRNKPKFYPTNLIYNEFKFNAQPLELYMFKVNISQFPTLHCCNKRLKIIVT